MNPYPNVWPPNHACIQMQFRLRNDVIAVIFITRDSEVIMFSPCVFVCLFVCVCGCLCLSRCLSGRFNYEGLVPHKQYFAGTLLGMSSCASYVSRTHDVIDDVTISQSRSKFEIDISPSIFELQRRSKAQNVGNAHGYLSGIFNLAQNGGHFENFEILNTASIWPQIWKDRPKFCQKKYFHDDDVIDGVTGWPQSRPSIFLYRWNNNIFHDNLETSKDIIIKLPVHRYHELMTTII